VEIVDTGSDLDPADLLGYMSLLVLILVLIGGGIEIIIARIKVWESKRAYRKAQEAHAKARGSHSVHTDTDS
jgi:hypothetical protein